eukprot:9449042-Pyramimonas_sp.AAC.1
MTPRMGMGGKSKVTVPESTAKPTKRSAKQSGITLDAGRQLIAEVGEYWTSSILWFRTYRSRDFENLLTRLSSKATKISTIADEGAAEVAEELYQLSVHLNDLKEFATSLRDTPESVITSLSPV